MVKTTLRLFLICGLMLFLLSMQLLSKFYIPSSLGVRFVMKEPMYGWKYNTSFPVDVVYTWVNGSDPNHRDTLERLRAELKRLKLLTAARSRNFQFHRFADNGGLKYSLRSLEKYANWIRHVFIVTNGQVPNWLNLENPRVSIITHEEFFDNIDFLPTFSSTAIEHNLHKIQGLSEKFIYVNDDIFFGNYSTLEDFYTEENGTKIYQGSHTPMKCSDTCRIEMIRNDVCDDVCNYDHCIWDGGDCDFITKLSPPDTDDPHSDHDTSIFYTNTIFNKAFGHKERRFNVHAPLFIDKSVNKMMLKRFSNEIRQTCRQTVRSPFDLQFGFSYMNFLMEAHNQSRYETLILTSKTAFMSVTNNEEKTRKDLTRLQHLHRKFYCLNDDIDYSKPSAVKIVKMLEEFYMSKFPFPSSFER